MAIIPSDEYTNIEDPDADYAYGSAINISAPGLFDSTPLEKLWVNDLWGFLQKLLVEAGITPSGIPDTIQTSDYWDALIDAVGRSMPIGGVTEFYGSSSPDPLILAESRDVLLKADYPELTTILGSYRPDLFTDVTPVSGTDDKVVVADSGDMIIVVGSEEVLYSEDGESWESVFINGAVLNIPGQITNAIWGGNKFIAVGGNPSDDDGDYILVSGNGKMWGSYKVEDTVNVVEPDSCSSIAYGGTPGSEFYVIGCNPADTGVNFFYGNLDGWTRSIVNDIVTLAIVTGITWNGSVWCAVGSSGKIWTSATAAHNSWTTQTPADSFGGFFHGIDSDDSGNLVAVGDGGVIQRSTDNGVTWTTITPDGGYSGDFNDIKFNGDYFCAVGDNDEIQTSPTGTTWTNQAIGGSPTAGDLIRVAGVGRICAAGLNTIQFSEALFDGYNNATEIVIPDMIPKNKNGYIPLMRAK